MGGHKVRFRVRNFLHHSSMVCINRVMMSFHFVLTSIARSKWGIPRKLHELGTLFFRNHFPCGRKKANGVVFFSLLDSQGARTKILGTIKLGSKICPEKILPVCKHILQMILRYT